jgi:hypothetical protein
VFEVEDRVFITDCRLDQSLGVVRRRWLDDLDPRCVKKIALDVLRVKRSTVCVAAARAANHDGHTGAPTITALGRNVGDLVERTRDKIDELHLGDGPHTDIGGADGRTNDRGFGNRCIDHALRSEMIEHPFCQLECTAIDAHVFAEDKDVFISFHLLPDTLPDCLDVCGLSH